MNSEYGTVGILCPMIAAVFPGQGSQKPGMGQSLATRSKIAARVFDEVTETTGRDLRKLCWDSTEDELRQTQNAQIALFTCGVAAWKALEDEVEGAAGHSVGEYAALVAAGVLTISDGSKLVQLRGDLMAKAGETSPGTMAAVLGLDRETLTAVCDSAHGLVVIANDNCPGQLVISGEVEAVTRASVLASEAGAKRVLPLNVSGAFHSPLMSGSAAAMKRALAKTQFNPPDKRVYSNVTSLDAQDSSAWPGLLERQLVSPVRWTESVQHMVGDGIEEFVECGGGEVLCGLIRRTDKTVATRTFN